MVILSQEKTLFPLYPQGMMSKVSLMERNHIRKCFFTLLNISVVQRGGDSGAKPREEAILVSSSGDDFEGRPEGKESFSKKFPFFILTISVVQVTINMILYTKIRPFTFRVTLINPSAFLDLLILLREN